jgi:hypothetical protein
MNRIQNEQNWLQIRMNKIQAEENRLQIEGKLIDYYKLKGIDKIQIEWNRLQNEQNRLQIRMNKI